MQAITVLGLAACLGVLFHRARKARAQPPRGLKKRFDTAHLLVGALLAWLMIGMHLQHLNRSLNGEPRPPRNTWEQVIETLTNWGI